MSEEQNQEKRCKCAKALVILSILKLVVLISILGVSIAILAKAPAISGGSGDSAAVAPSNQGGGDEVKISTQYDKGQSLKKAQETNKPIIAFFYTDWCGFCQRFAPTFDEISKESKIKKNFAIAYVNCEKEENRIIVEEYNVQAYPTVYVIDKQGKRKQLDNSTFYNDDSKDVVAKKALEIIGAE